MAENLYKLRPKQPEGAKEPQLGDAPRSTVECIRLLTEAQKAIRRAKKTVELCKAYATKTGDRIIRDDDKVWKAYETQTECRCNLKLGEVIELLQRCSVPGEAIELVDQALAGMGVGAMKAGQRWEWRWE